MSKESVKLEGGKYEVVNDAGKMHCLRHGETWRDLTGDKMVGAMFNEIQSLRATIAEVHSWIVCAAISTPEDMMQNAEHIAEITEPGTHDGMQNTR